jgi:hypothetical protein
MKILLLFSALIFGCSAANAQKTTKWTADQRNAFMKECVEEAKTGMSLDSADHYCSCMIGKIEQKNMSYDSANQLTTEMLESKEWQDLILECLHLGWNHTERSEFMSSCIPAASNGMSADSARKYCACMQLKLENKYPDYTKASKLTAETFQSPEMKKEIRDCLTMGGWTKTERETFINDCAEAAKELGTKARSYCSCIAPKIEAKYPNYAVMDKYLTPAILTTPEWQKIIGECLK